MQKCTKCGGHCKPSKAYQNDLLEYLEYGAKPGDRGNTISRSGKARLVNCLKCESCGHSFIPPKAKELTLQEKVLQKVKKFYLEGASIRNQLNCIKINAYVLVDKDLEFFKSIEGMYSNIEIKRSGKGLVIILNFESYGN